MQYFFILSKPRSGTAWLSNFLTYDNSWCIHEGLKNLSSTKELKLKLDGLSASVAGDADTMNVLVPKSLIRTFPKAKYIVIHRDMDDIKEFLWKIGVDDNGIDFMEDKFRNSIEVLKETNCEFLEVDFKGLFNERMLGIIWEFVNPSAPFNEKRAEMLIRYNITETLESMFDDLDASKIVSLREEEDGGT